METDLYRGTTLILLVGLLFWGIVGCRDTTPHDDSLSFRINAMEVSSSDGAIRLRVLSIPNQVTIGQHFAVEVEIENTSTRSVVVERPFPWGLNCDVRSSEEVVERDIPLINPRAFTANDYIRLNPGDAVRGQLSLVLAEGKARGRDASRALRIEMAGSTFMVPRKGELVVHYGSSEAPELVLAAEDEALLWIGYLSIEIPFVTRSDAE